VIFGGDFVVESDRAQLSEIVRRVRNISSKRQITEETIHMKAIVVTDQAAGTAGMKLAERPEPQAAINATLMSSSGSQSMIVGIGERWTCDGFGTAPSTPPVSAAIWGIPAIKSM
jgi:hypothetical protein